MPIGGIGMGITKGQGPVLASTASRFHPPINEDSQDARLADATEHYQPACVHAYRISSSAASEFQALHGSNSMHRPALQSQRLTRVAWLCCVRYLQTVTFGKTSS
jgi:hypothetical protein